MRRKGSNNHHFRKRVPADKIDAVRGSVFTVTFPPHDDSPGFTAKAKVGDAVVLSLRTADASLAKRLHAVASEAFERFLQTREALPAPLSQEQRAAIAGSAYRKLLGDFGANPGEPGMARANGWEVHMDELADALRYFEPQEDGATGPAYNPLAGAKHLEKLIDLDQHLASVGVPAVLPGDRPFLLRDIAEARHRACSALLRRTEGDWATDPAAERFPSLGVLQSLGEAIKKPDMPRNAGLTLTALLEGWWAEASAAGRKLATYQNYSGAVRALIAFAGHDDALMIDPDVIVAFKSHRLKTVSPKTVRDVDLAALKTIFKWAVSNRQLKVNPAADIAVERFRAPKLRSKGFTDPEALALLGAAFAYRQGPNESPKMAAAKRWIPWILAYTGARVGEICQLRKEDFRREHGRWIIRITPEAGPVKTDEAREVVLHRHLEETGLPEVVEASEPGYLFLAAKGLATVQGPLTTLKNRLSEAARLVIKDRNVAPNHGWRHRFKTVGVEAGIDHRILDAIQGQKARIVAESYGDVTLVAQANAIDRLPRYQVNGAGD